MLANALSTKYHFQLIIGSTHTQVQFSSSIIYHPLPQMESRHMRFCLDTYLTIDYSALHVLPDHTYKSAYKVTEHCKEVLFH